MSGVIESGAKEGRKFSEPKIVGDAPGSSRHLMFSRDPNGTRIEHREEGETGKAFGRLSEARFEAIAEWFAMPRRFRGRGDVPGSIVELADRLGVSPSVIRRASKSRRVVDRMAELHRIAASHMMGDTLQAMFDAVQERHDAKSALFVRDVASLGHTTPQLLNYVNINSSTQTVYLSTDQIASDDSQVIAQASELLKKLGIARMGQVEAMTKASGAIEVEAIAAEDPGSGS